MKKPKMTKATIPAAVLAICLIAASSLTASAAAPDGDWEEYDVSLFLSSEEIPEAVEGYGLGGTIIADLDNELSASDFADEAGRNEFFDTLECASCNIPACGEDGHTISLAFYAKVDKVLGVDFTDIWGFAGTGDPWWVLTIGDDDLGWAWIDTVNDCTYFKIAVGGAVIVTEDGYDTGAFLGTEFCLYFYEDATTIAAAVDGGNVVAVSQTLYFPEITITAPPPPSGGGASKPSPAPVPEPGPAADPTPSNFVIAFYEKILGRTPDPAEMQGWIDALDDGSITATQLAYGFIFSAEMALSGDLSNDEFIELLYNVLLGRPSDPGFEGKDGWVAALDAGMPRADIIALFTGTEEFGAICDLFGIKA